MICLVAAQEVPKGLHGGGFVILVMEGVQLFLGLCMLVQTNLFPELKYARAEVVEIVLSVGISGRL
jgi:hypothetical protein